MPQKITMVVAAKTVAQTESSRHVHAHWDCSHGISLKAMLMASLRIIPKAQKDSAVTLETCRDTLASHLASLFFGFGLVNDPLTIQLDATGHDVTNVQVEVSNESIQKIQHTHGAFHQRFTYSLQTHDSVSDWSTRAATSALTLLYQSRTYSADQAMALEHVRYEVTSAIETVAVLWCLDQLHVRSISYSPLPLPVDIILDESSQHGIYQGMTVLPGAASEGCTVSDTAAILLKVMTQTTDNVAPSMQLMAATKGLDEPHDAPNSRMTTLVLGHVVTAPADSMTTEPPMDEPTSAVPKKRIRDPQQSTTSLWKTDTMMEVQANIDDMTAEHLAFCVDRLLQAGAADAWTTPIVMKKGRPAVTLHCLCREEYRDKLLKELFQHSTTLGVRLQPMERASLRREMIRVQTEWTKSSNKGRVGVKVGYLGNEIVSIKAEFDHCRAISTETGVPIQAVAEQAKRNAQQQLDEDLEVLVELVPPEYT